MLEVRPMPGHEVIEEALSVHRAPGRFKQLQRDRRFFFEVFYKTKARVHAGTTEQSIWVHALIPSKQRKFQQLYDAFYPQRQKFVRMLTVLQLCFGRQSRTFTTSDTSHTHPCNHEPDGETLPARFRR
jgi:hypothetical protein